MNNEIELIARAQEILKEISQGINPLTKKKIEGDNFVNNPKMIRCFMFCADMLERAKVKPKNTNTIFLITKEQKEQINISFDTVGLKLFVRCVNEVIDESISRRASQAKITNSLKTLGILGERVTDGHKSTITIPTSADYGFETKRVVFGEKKYDQVVANRKGQKYLIDNLEMLMGERG